MFLLLPGVCPFFLVLGLPFLLGLGVGLFSLCMELGLFWPHSRRDGKEGNGSATQKEGGGKQHHPEEGLWKAAQLQRRTVRVHFLDWGLAFLLGLGVAPASKRKAQGERRRATPRT